MSAVPNCFADTQGTKVRMSCRLMPSLHKAVKVLKYVAGSESLQRGTEKKALCKTVEAKLKFEW